MGMLKHLHSHHLRLQEHTTNGPSTFHCHHPLPGRIPPHQQRRHFLSTVSVMTFLLPCVSVISQLGSASPSLHIRTEPAKTGISSLPGCLTTFLLPCVHVFILSGTTSSSHVQSQRSLPSPLHDASGNAFAAPFPPHPPHSLPGVCVASRRHPPPHQVVCQFPVKVWAVGMCTSCLATCCCLADHSNRTDVLW